MTEPLFSAALTVLVGVLVLVTGQVAIKFFIEPIQHLKLQVGKINHALYYYADLYSNPTLGNAERRERVAKHFRTHASELRAKGNVVSWYAIWSTIGFIPAERKVAKAAQCLVDISNTVQNGSTEDKAYEKAKEIEELLGLRFRG